LSAPQRDAFTGLRGVAALTVVVIHVHNLATPEPVRIPVLSAVLGTLPAAITVFFVLSGYLVYRRFARAHAEGRQVDVHGYASRRLVRLVPTYWFVLLICALVLPAAQMHGADGAIVIGRLTEPGLLLIDALMLQAYVPTAMSTGIAAAWTLTTELTFYAVAAIVAGGVGVVITRHPRRSLIWLPPALLVAVGLGVKLLDLTGVFGVGPVHHLILLSFPFNADAFGLGMGVAVAEVLYVGRQGRVAGQPWQRFATAGVVLAPAVFVAGMVLRAPYAVMTLTAAVTAAMVMALIRFPRPGVESRFTTLLGVPWLVRVGFWSYELYLWHGPIIRLAAKAGVTQGGVGGLLVNLAGVLAVSLAVSALTHRWLEVPVMTLAHRGAVRRHLDQRATEQRAGGQRSTEPLSDVRASAVW
jgi:peptidoglycan/LPS O-acetylase OafA/YrhL